MLIQAPFGRTDSMILLIGVLAIALVGAATDVFYGKIFNWLTFPGLFAGIIVSTWIGGWSGLGSAMTAVAAGLLLYGWLFALGAMGAGDVKFLMALGAWGGSRFVAETALLGFIVGGVFSIAALIYRGTLIDFCRRMHHFLLTLLLKELEVEKPRIDHSATFPFGIPIAIAAAWVALGHPLNLLGVSLW